MAWMK
jgi:DNA-directed RNA polymerase II subunit RPB2